jgi:hypothetical protein
MATPRSAAEYPREVLGITTYDLEGGGSGLGVAIGMSAFCKAMFQGGSC